MTERIDHERLGRTTRRRVLALVSLLVALMAVGLLSLRALKHATDEEERAISLLLAIDRFETALRDAEIGQRDYLLTGDERGYDRFEAAAKELERRREEVAEAAHGDEEFLEDVERLRESVTSRLSELRRAVTMLQDRGSEDAVELVVAIEDSAAAASLQEQRQASRAEIERRTRARAREVEGSYRVAMINLAVGGVLGILVLGVLILSMSRNLRRERMHIHELEDQRELLRATLSGIGDVVITTSRDGS
ncbi:MAG: CHASE3 domain-containing protein, partial [Planctomycetota bacterium JB042]